MEPEGSSPRWQDPTTCPCSEPDQLILCPHTPLPERSILILFSHLRLGLPSDNFLPRFPTKTLYTPLPYVLHAPPISYYTIRTISHNSPIYVWVFQVISFFLPHFPTNPCMHLSHTCYMPLPSHIIQSGLYLIILPSTSGFFKWFLSSTFPHQSLYAPHLIPIYDRCLTHLVLLDLIILVIQVRRICEWFVTWKYLR